MKNVKGIILAGGLGTRLYPLTKVTNKHLLPIGNEPMIYYPLRKLMESGVRDIMIVTGVEHSSGVTSLLGSGKDYDCSFTYRVQDRPDGIAGALKLCKDFIGNSSCVVILGDNIFKEDLTPHIKSFCESDDECRLFFKRVADPQRYGVGTFDEEKIIGIEEKPQHPQSDYACVGIYFYTPKVFDIIDTIEPSERGELEISSVNNIFIERRKCTYSILKDRWVDAGTLDAYHKTNWIVYKEK